jgi:hypothetical protein
MWRCVVFVRTDVSEELIISIIGMTIGELGTTLAVTTNRSMLRKNTMGASCHPDDLDTFLQYVSSYKSHTDITVPAKYYLGFSSFRPCVCVCVCVDER